MLKECARNGSLYRGSCSGRSRRGEHARCPRLSEEIEVNSRNQRNRNCNIQRMIGADLIAA